MRSSQQSSRRSTRFAWLLLAAVCVFVNVPAFAQATPQTPPGVTVPRWQELTPEQQQALMPLAQEWDHLPASRRVHALERVQRQQHWQRMSPEQRRTLKEGFRRFEQLPPHLRERMRQSIRAVLTLPPEQQRHLRERWRQLSPEQRHAWLQAGGPGISPPPDE